jgi:iron-sulfur cluster repair protein YtfE (RIC family)
MPVSSGRREVHAVADRSPVEVFQQAISEHGFTSEYVATTLHGNALFEEAHPDRRRYQMRRFLSENVVRHFAFEEKNVFPALRRGTSASIGRLVDELVAEHETMLAQVRALRRSLGRLNSASNPDRWVRLERSFREFLRTLLGHSMKEDNLFLALKQDIR